MVADCMTLWIGEELGAVERACLRSVMRHGSSVALYCYGRPAGVPEGVDVRDAAAVLPESKVFTGRNGSFAAFSDWFRYELLERGCGTWVDTDIYLLKPLDGRGAYLFGEESDGILNNAVLRLPADSPIVRLLLEPFRAAGIPRGLTWRQRLPLQIDKLFRARTDLATLPWGSTGPLALTALAREFGLGSRALPSDAFYPVRWQDAAWVGNPAVKLQDMITERTVAIHLWNECIKDFKNLAALEGSFLSRLQEEGRE